MNWKTALYFIAAVTVSCAAANPNLFPQGDFEEWAPYPRNDVDKMKITGGLAPKNWKCSGSKTVLSRDENVKYSGKSSVKLVFSPGSASELLYQPFPVKPGTKYRISFRIKGENLSFTSRTQAPWGGLQASPSAEKPWIDKKGELIFTRKSGTFDWTLLRHYRGDVPFLLSGGLRPDSLDALRAFSHPRWAGIDLNSGFETRPGMKDIGALAGFINAIKAPPQPSPVGREPEANDKTTPRPNA